MTMREVMSGLGAVATFFALAWLISMGVLDGEHFWQLMLVLVAVGGVYNAVRSSRS